MLELQRRRRPRCVSGWGLLTWRPGGKLAMTATIVPIAVMPVPGNVITAPMSAMRRPGTATAWPTPPTS